MRLLAITLLSLAVGAIAAGAAVGHPLAAVGVLALAVGWARSEYGRRCALRGVAVLAERGMADLLRFAPEEAERRFRVFMAEERDGRPR